MGEEILSLGIVTEGSVEYIDVSEVTELKASSDAASGFTDLFRETLRRGWRGAVFFAPEDHRYGMVRMLGAVLEGMQDAPTAALVARPEPTAPADVRDVIARHLGSSGSAGATPGGAAS